jgi:hypothetical protein
MCVPSCVDDLGGAEGECLPATEAYLQCIGTLTCEQAIDFLMNGNPGPCAEQVAEFDQLCEAGSECSIGQGGNPQETECSIDIQCMGEPSLEMQCNQQECVCLIDGMQEGGPCPAEMICKNSDALLDKAEQCCGFMP